MELSLNGALAALRQQAEVKDRSEILLVCGFQPLHLVTFLKAHFAVRFPDRGADILLGLYGDLDGTLAEASRSSATAAAVAIEWGDLDARLSLRSSGGWGRSQEQDILANCQSRWTTILERVTALAARMPVALVLPTLSSVFFGHTPGGQLSAAEAELTRQLASFTAEAANLSNVRLLHPSRLARLSPDSARRDANLEFAAGFPYSVGHASILGRLLIDLLFPKTPMKGLITDLDDTFWSGIVGEVGAHAVSWSLTEHSPLHGLYQQELRHLSEIGVLLAVVSKNDPAVVEEALRREDLYVPAASFFPVKASWGRKSQAVGEILEAWNVGADSVVFVDDSPMEIDEVRAAFPSMTCLLFTPRRAAQTLELLEQVRDLFGKPAVHAEDTLRQASIRVNSLLKEEARQAAGGDFVRALEGKLTFDERKSATNKRWLELINKTNQFNLNGLRVTEGEWLRILEDDQVFAAGISYEDKFGPLGVIGVITGRQQPDGVAEISSWVLSCRAFSRQIEHHTLEYLFRHRGARAVRLRFQATERNGPLQDHLRLLGLDCTAATELELTGLETPSELPHEVEILKNG